MPDTASILVSDLRDARARTLELVADLSDAQLLVPRLDVVNPILWEIGHVAWFQEWWCLRRDGRASLRPDADALYDSSAVHHDTRWDLRLPTRAQTLRYMDDVLQAVAERAADPSRDERAAYFARLATFHEDMHGEALVYTRRTLGYAPPRTREAIVPGRGGLTGDADVPGGTFLLGGSRSEPFVFDNEKWEHARRVEPFRIARAAVTQGEFARFVDGGGYRRRELWSDAGWQWRTEAAAESPLDWTREAGGPWLRRHYDRSVPLEEHAAMLHVNWHEAQAYCAWAGRRLPTELEWEVAALGEPDARGLAATKRRFPWGDDAPTPARAHLDLAADGPCDVGAYPLGDSAFGCRQLIGNTWEWCEDAFAPYSGFVADPYADYSQPWFGTHRVLRGGCFATRARLLRGTWRNFYAPERRDVLAGFRTCAR